MHFENHNEAAGFGIVIGLDNKKSFGSKISRHAGLQRIPRFCEKLNAVASKGVGNARNGRTCLNYIFKRLLPLVASRKYVT